MGLIWIIGSGVGLLITLAVIIGQRNAREIAWRHIAQERRELNAWELELIEAAEGRGCAACRLRRAGDRR